MECLTFSSARRRFSAGVIAMVLSVCATQLAVAATWPAQPISITVGYAAGGGTDFVVRAISPYLQERLGQPVVIINKPGASAVLAANAVANAAPDGYNLFGTDGGALALNGALFSQLTYDPVKDFSPISMIIRAPLLVVANPAFAPSTLKELLDLSKRETLSYASVGKGAYHHLAAERLKSKMGLQAEDIPYKGASPAVQDVLAGHVPFMVVDTIVGLPYIRAGKLKVLASLTQERLATLPDVPTAAEQGVADVDAYAWVGIAAPSQTPDAILERLAMEIAQILEIPEVAQRFKDLGMEPVSTSPDEFRAYVNNEIDRWHPVIRSLDLRLD